MRKLASLLLIASPLMSYAGPTEGLFGTKTNPVAPVTESSGGGAPILQMIVALVIVLAAVKWILPKMMNKFGNKLVTKLGGGIRIEESANFAGGSLHIINARGKTLLLSVGTTGVSCLADLTETSPQPESIDFEKVLESSPEYAVAEVETTPTATPEVAQALERLRQLVG